jgi:predicted dehydrogenase
MTTQQPRRLRLGMIGVGSMGRHHVSHWEKMPGVEIVAIADIDPARLHNNVMVGGNIPMFAPQTDFEHLERYDDGRDLIRAAEVDCVDICTPSDLHAEMAVLAAQAGRHVIVEKPMALSSADAQRMAAAAAAANVSLMVAQVVRFWPEYLYLRETVASGRLGKLMTAEFVRRGSRPRWSARNWFSDVKRSGGAIFDLHVHDVDFVNYLLGAPYEVQATGVRSPEATGHDLIAARFTYRDGISVTVDGGWYAPGNYGFYSRYEAVFERGVVRYHGGMQPTLTVMHNDDDTVETPEVSGDPYAAEMAYFADCLLRGCSPAEQHPPESSIASLQLVEAEVASIATGRAVRL